MSDVAEALVDVLLDEVPRQRSSRLQHVLGWLADVTKPPVGVRLVSDDGGTFTGFLIVEDNRPLVMLAVRTGGVVRHAERGHRERDTPIEDDVWPERPDVRLT